MDARDQRGGILPGMVMGRRNEYCTNCAGNVPHRMLRLGGSGKRPGLPDAAGAFRGWVRCRGKRCGCAYCRPKARRELGTKRGGREPAGGGWPDASSEQGSRLRDVNVRESDDAPLNCLRPRRASPGSHPLKGPLLRPSTAIAAELVVRAQPDGYTLFVGEFGPNVMAGSLFPKLAYDPARDFAHVTQLVSFPLVLVVPAASPTSSVTMLIEQAKAKPGALKYSTGGIGNSTHLFVALINLMARVDTVPVHYRGGAPALLGVIGAEVDYTMISVSTALPQLGAGRVRALAVTSAQAIPRLPSVPPISSVLPGYEGLALHGLHAPANTPRTIVTRLYQEVGKVLRRPDIKERFDGLAMDVSGSTPEEFTAFIRKQIETWGAVARAANVRAD
jgi:tripartite-type tricarboxylate transporter receptor subunit TctC